MVNMAKEKCSLSNRGQEESKPDQQKDQRREIWKSPDGACIYE
jgi:hypothetical protein